MSDKDTAGGVEALGMELKKLPNALRMTPPPPPPVGPKGKAGRGGGILGSSSSTSL